MARTIRIIGEVSSPSTALRAFVEEAVPILVEDHYLRWVKRREGGPGVFQVQGWACNPGTFDHQEHLENLASRRYGTDFFSTHYSHSYCNAVTDTDLWIIAGLAELLAVAEPHAEHYGISNGDFSLLQEHVKRESPCLNLGMWRQT